MISTKMGTQSWSKAAQEHNFGEDKSVHYTAAVPDAPATGPGSVNGGVKGVGDFLNSIANPGGKDPNLHVRKAHNTLDKDDFLKLMLTQMKNQDPMNPMQSHEMAAQLAQFTSLEQLFNVNKNLEGLAHAQDPVQKYEALNFLGRTIKADTRQIVRTSPDEKSELRFNLGKDAIKVKVTISDEMGNPLKTLEYGNLKAGPNKVSWNGLNDKDQDVKAGKFTFNVLAEDTQGKKVAVMTETSGTITGINYSAEGPMLMVGDQKVRLQDVEKIEDDNLKTAQNIREQMQLQGGNGAVPEDVLKNLGVQSKAKQGENQGDGNGQQGADAAAKRLLQGLFDGPKPIDTSAGKMKVKPENKPEAKLTGAVLPLEVASANAGGGVGSGNGISAGGAFGRK